MNLASCVHMLSDFIKIKKVVYQNQSKYLGGMSSSMPLLITTEVPPSWSKPPIINHVKEKSD